MDSGGPKEVCIRWAQILYVRGSYGGKDMQWAVQKWLNLTGGHIGASWRIRLNCPSVVARRCLLCHITLTTCLPLFCAGVSFFGKRWRVCFSVATAGTGFAKWQPHCKKYAGSYEMCGYSVFIILAVCKPPNVQCVIAACPVIWLSDKYLNIPTSFSSRSELHKVLFMARLQTWRAIIFSRVCLSVCVSACLFNVDQFWRNLVTRTLLWSSLAATIIVQIGLKRDSATPFWKFQKILNHRIQISKFWSIIFCVCVSCVL